MRNISIRQMEYAVAVADELHFGRAADRLQVSQPGLSSQIRELERKLGGELFERSTRGVRIVGNGFEIIDRARRILTDVDELTALAKMRSGEVTGTIEIAAIPTVAPYLLPAVVATLNETWPNARLQLRELQTTALIAAIEHGSVDVGVLALPFEVGSLVTRAVVDDKFHLALPADHELSGGASLPVEVLAELPVLLLEDGHCLREHAQAVCAIAGRVETTEVRSAGLATLTQMVAAGLGVTLLPESALPVEARPGSGISTRPFHDPAPSRTIALAWRPTDPRAQFYERAADDIAAAVRV